jgi:hypothetical protein
VALESLKLGLFRFLLLSTVQNGADAGGAAVLVVFAALDPAHVLEATLEGLFQLTFVGTASIELSVFVIFVMFFDLSRGDIVLVFSYSRLFFGKREGTASVWGLSYNKNCET